MKSRQRFFRPVQFDPRAVRAYLEREVDDWRWIKSVPREALLEQVPKGFKFYTDPRTHQLACFLVGLDQPRFLFLLGMGGGKTKLILDLIRYRKHRKQLGRALVLYPNVINLETWLAQVAAHAPDLSVTPLVGSAQKRWELLESTDTDLCVMNFAGLGVFGAGQNRRGKAVVDPEAMDRLMSHFNFFAVDETHLGLSSHQSLFYDLCRYASEQVEFAYGCTGTVMDSDPTKIYSQFAAIDLGETFGPNFPLYRSAFFNAVKVRWGSGTDWRFDGARRGDLSRMMQHRSLRYEDAEVNDLPDMMPVTQIIVPMSKDQRDFDTAMREEQRAKREAGESPQLWIRQRQTVAGFRVIKLDSEKHFVPFAKNPKGEALAQWVQELPEDEKFVISHEFIPSGVLITQELKKLGVTFAGVGNGFKTPGLELRRFLTDHRCRAFVMNSAAGGTGVDGLQRVARYGFLYETPSSPSRRRQVLKRLHRDGQQRRVYWYETVARGIDIDSRLLKSIEQGQDLFASIVDRKEETV